MSRPLRLRQALDAHQVRIYFVAMALGAGAAAVLPRASGWNAAINPALALMLFATFLQVPVAHMGRSLRSGRFLGALVVTHFVAMPMIVGALIWFAPDLPLLRLGMLMVLLAPCVDYVITFTHLGRGDASRLLSATPVLLGLQMLLLPLFIGGLLGSDLGELIGTPRSGDPPASGTSGSFALAALSGPFVQTFVWLIAVPLIFAAALQTIASRHTRAEKVIEGLSTLPVPATALVLFIVLAVVVPQISEAQGAAMAAAPFYLAFALIAPIVGAVVSRAFALDDGGSRAVSYSAAYRNSLVILPLAFAIPGGAPVLPAVILTQTIVELAMLPLYARWIPRLTARPVR